WSHSDAGGKLRSPSWLRSPGRGRGSGARSVSAVIGRCYLRVEATTRGATGRGAPRFSRWSVTLWLGGAGVSQPDRDGPTGLARNSTLATGTCRVLITRRQTLASVVRLSSHDQ